MSSSVPQDPLARFIAIARELVTHERWFEGATVIRYAAMPLLLSDGAAPAVAARVAADSTALAQQQGWFDDLRGSIHAASERAAQSGAS